MKLLLFLLSIYLLVLGCLPCTDKVAVVAPGQPSVSAACPRERHCHEQEEACTPLCSCNCCGVPATVPVKAELFRKHIELLVTNRKIFHDQQTPLCGICSRIWQPPRVG